MDRMNQVNGPQGQSQMANRNPQNNTGQTFGMVLVQQRQRNRQNGASNPVATTQQ